MNSYQITFLAAEESKSSLEVILSLTGAVVGVVGVLISLYVLLLRDPDLRRKETAQRDAEELERNMAQARSIVTLVWDDNGSGTCIQVRNLSNGPIFDVDVTVTVRRPDGLHRLAPGHDITPYPDDLDHILLLEPGKSIDTLSADCELAKVTWETSFVDARGVRWTRVNDGQPVRVLPTVE